MTNRPKYMLPDTATDKPAIESLREPDSQRPNHRRATDDAPWCAVRKIGADRHEEGMRPRRVCCKARTWGKV